MSKILFASQNKGKQREVAALFAPVTHITLIFPEEFPELADLDPEETGSTFQENALIKAKTWFEKVTIGVVAEDTGLEIDALDGKPGVHSKRFFAGSDQERNQEILRQLQGKQNRSTQFKTVACLLLPNQQPHFFEGIIRGTIANEITGDKGFGYDPIFIPEGSDQTFAQLGSEFKNQFSSRAKAISQVVTVLNK